MSVKVVDMDTYNTYIYQVMVESPHPSGHVNTHIVSRLVFSGDAVLLAKINQAVADVILNHKSDNKK